MRQTAVYYRNRACCYLIKPNRLNLSPLPLRKGARESLFPKNNPSETDKDSAKDQTMGEVYRAVHAAAFCASMARALGVAVT